ncbi:serine/threonine-protein kinase pkn5 [Streptomyces scabiei]|uniref:non-specific serine/threonine protein kinase n=1 Tax=Streptomyces scabiei TaxID=1930 RepID=A0A100JTB4_STRSC|nr:serine/threonine-protein kinase pkn5 [Streptomyces scabiei]
MTTAKRNPDNRVPDSPVRSRRRQEDAFAHHAVLTDFGIAAIQNAEALTMAGMRVGSPDYMAPERVSGRPQGPPSDLWSLGATLCAALGGRFDRRHPLCLRPAPVQAAPRLLISADELSASVRWVTDTRRRRIGGRTLCLSLRLGRALSFP